MKVLQSRSQWSWHYFKTWSQNYIYNKYFLNSFWRILWKRKANFCLLFVWYYKWLYMAVAGTGAVAEIMDKGGARAELKWFQLHNTAYKERKTPCCAHTHYPHPPPTPTPPPPHYSLSLDWAECKIMGGRRGGYQIPPAMSVVLQPHMVMGLMHTSFNSWIGLFLLWGG